MGGPGSGTWIRTARHRGSDSVPRLNISNVSQAVGLKQPGNVGKLSWTIYGCALVSYRLMFDGEYVYLAQDVTGGLRARQAIRLATTDCYFGGHRRWFLCPKCDPRAAVLYAPSTSWLCFGCSNIRYSSQQVGYEARLARRLRNLRAILGGSHHLHEPLRPKPKGM